MAAYTVRWSKIAIERVKEFGDRRIREKIFSAAAGLATDPHQQGLPLTGELVGYRRIRFSRYRIIYAVDDQNMMARIVTVGIRKQGKPGDVYALARKLLSAGLLEAEE